MSVGTYLARRWDVVLQLTIEHLIAVAMGVGIATIIGVTLAVLVYRNDRAVTLLLDDIRHPGRWRFPRP